MAETYLTPADVSPLAARRVLDFLNAAQTAQEIADRVEIPGEPDVGLIVGQHLIDARDALGGFTDLQQVADVRQVGRERFTEIVTVLGGMRVITSNRAVVDGLQDEVQELRRTISRLAAERGTPSRSFSATRFVDRTVFSSGTGTTDMSDSSDGAARVRLDGDEMRRLETTGALIIGSLRRPQYFDGRFLAARDLTREQNYFLSRQANVARTSGGGIVHGLFVTRGPTATSIVISAGHGVTSSGETIVVNRDLRIDLGNIAEIQRLDRAFGLSRLPRTPARHRSGIFVVGLRPVEFTANPIPSYPTSVDGNRTVEDGDIIEGAVVSLVPYRDDGARNEFEARRAEIARETFVEGADKSKNADVVPVAVVALDRGRLEFIDPYLVRREFGAEQKDVLGLGFAPRVLREAHLLQYDSHLEDVLEARARLNLGNRFAAAEHFHALPSAGRLPTASIDATDFTQLYFPSEVDVELSLIPDDEVAALLEESLVLPPIDLSLQGEAQESTSVLVLVPVDRPRLRSLAARMTSLTRQLRAAAPGLVAQRRPIEALRGLSRIRLPLPSEQPEAIADGEWQSVLAESEMLWYVRRRDVHLTAPVVAESVAVDADEAAAESALDQRLRQEQLVTAFRALPASSPARGDIVSMLTAPVFLTGSPMILRGAIAELAQPAALTRVAVQAVRQRYSRSGFGTGIQRLESVHPPIAQGSTPRNLAAALIVPELDHVSTLITDDAQLLALAQRLEQLTTSAEIASLVRQELQRRLRPVRPPGSIVISRPGLTAVGSRAVLTASGTPLPTPGFTSVRSVAASSIVAQPIPGTGFRVASTPQR